MVPTVWLMVGWIWTRQLLLISLKIQIIIEVKRNIAAIYYLPQTQPLPLFPNKRSIHFHSLDQFLLYNDSTNSTALCLSSLYLLIHTTEGLVWPVRTVPHTVTRFVEGITSRIVITMKLRAVHCFPDMCERISRYDQFIYYIMLFLILKIFKKFCSSGIQQKKPETFYCNVHLTFSI